MKVVMVKVEREFEEQYFETEHEVMNGLMRQIEQTKHQSIMPHQSSYLSNQASSH